jgi:antitoxin (DNA-binding transcriptional repressor) of toxin-antitoxin stability system
VVVTVHGEPVAQIAPIARSRPRSLPRRDLLEIIERHQADPGLADDLRRLAGETTDDLGPIE